MAPRRTIIDGLHRCLCPKYFNSLLPRSNGPVTLVIARLPLSPPTRNFSSSALRHQSDTTPRPTLQRPNHYPGQLPPLTPVIRKIPAPASSDSSAPRRVAYQPYNGGSAILYRSQDSVYTGINKVIDLATRAIFPDVFLAALELVREEGYEPDRKLFTALIEACANFPGCLLQSMAFRLLDEMKERGLEPDSVIYHHLLRLLANSPDYLKRSQILSEMKQRWFKLTDEGWQNVIMGHLLDGQLEVALETVDKRRMNGEIIHRNTYRDLIQKLCAVGEIDEALRLVRELETELTWVTPPALAYHLLVAATDQFHLEATLFFWRKIIDKDMFNPDDGLCLATLNVAARYGDPPLATDVFRVLANRGLQLEEQHYAALLESYVVAGDLVAAFSVLAVMERAGVATAEHTTRPIIAQLLSSGEAATEKAFAVLQKMRRTNKLVGIPALNVLIATHVKRGNVDAAFEIYNAMPDFDLRPETSTFNLLLKGAALQGNKEFAINMVSEMKEAKVEPNADTYEWLFKACLVQDDYEDAFAFLEEMRGAGIVPRIRMLRALASRCYLLGDGRYRVAMVEMVNRGVNLAGFTAELDAQLQEQRERSVQV